MNRTFYQALYSNQEFVAAVGRIILSSARLESEIKSFVEAHGGEIGERATLGKLISLLVGLNKINKTAIENLQFVLHQRNYFVHRLFANLDGYLENEFELNRFVNRVKSLGVEMDFFSKIFAQEEMISD